MPIESQSPPQLHCLLSFRPFLMVLKKMIAEDIPGAKSLYGDLVESLEANPELLAPSDDEKSLRDHQKIVETLCATIFPPATTKNESPYAVIYPFNLRSIYASSPFTSLFIKKELQDIELPDDDSLKKFNDSCIALAYNLILTQCYNAPPSYTDHFVFSYNDPEKGFKKMEMKLDGRFMQVKKTDPSWKMPEEKNAALLPQGEELTKLLPLDKF